MVKLAVFLENWPCKTRLHGSLAKPLIQDNIAPPAFFSADAHDAMLTWLKSRVRRSEENEQDGRRLLAGVTDLTCPRLA